MEEAQPWDGFSRLNSFVAENSLTLPANPCLYGTRLEWMVGKELEQERLGHEVEKREKNKHFPTQKDPGQWSPWP